MTKHLLINAYLLAGVCLHATLAAMNTENEGGSPGDAVSSSAPPASEHLILASATASRLRHLQGYNINADELEAAEIGFLVAIALLLLVCILCCCCRRCNLWDIVALACLWEICCDRDDSVGGFMLI